MNIVFDCGSFIPEIAHSKHIFITHGHCDHIGATIQHARVSSKTNAEPGTVYYMPPECVGSLTDAKAAFERLDADDIKMNIQPMTPQDTPINIGSGFSVFSFPTTHRVTSQGYCIKHTKEQLLPQYSEMDKDSLRKLILSNQVQPVSERFQIKHMVDSYEIAYTGDTTIDALINNPINEFLLSVPILLIEMTYIDGDRNEGRDRGHIHIDDFVEYHERFQNSYIIFLHLSNKYQRKNVGHENILDLLRKKVPEILHERIGVSLKSFGAPEFISPLLERRSSVVTGLVIKEKEIEECRGPFEVVGEEAVAVVGKESLNNNNSSSSNIILLCELCGQSTNNSSKK